MSVRNLVVARGVTDGTGFLLYYYTMTVLPLGDAATLLSLSPVITVLAARVFLHEKFRTIHVLAAASCLVGSVLLAQPSLFFVLPVFSVVFLFNCSPTGWRPARAAASASHTRL